MYTKHQLERLRTVSIPSVLASFNVEPARKQGHQLVYHSPLPGRKDSTPSFFVDPVDNIWKDFGAGNTSTGKSGGNVIDLVMVVGEVDFEGAVDFLLPFLGEQPGQLSVATEKQQGTALLDLVVKPLTNPSMLDYLEQRGIAAEAIMAKNPAVRERLRQATYRNDNSATYHTNLAWLNDVGGIELKGPGRGGATFTRCHGNKACTLVPGTAGTKARLVVFECFIDYLSLLMINKWPTHQADVLVLNSTTRFKEGLQVALDYAELWLYLDHDKSGHDTTAAFQVAHPNAIDKSADYAGYEDVNDWLLERPIPPKGAKTAKQAKTKAQDPTNSHRKDEARWWLYVHWVTPQRDKNGREWAGIPYYCFDDTLASLTKLKQLRSRLAKRGLIDYSRLCERLPGTKPNGKANYKVLEQKDHLPA